MRYSFGQSLLNCSAGLVSAIIGVGECFKKDSFDNLDIKGIAGFYRYISKDAHDLKIKIKSSNELTDIDKKILLNNLEKEINNLDNFKVSLIDANFVEEKYFDIIQELIYLKKRDYDFINKISKRKDLDYYIQIISWYKISYISVYNSYKELKKVATEEQTEFESISIKDIRIKDRYNKKNIEVAKSIESVIC